MPLDWDRVMGEMVAGTTALIAKRADPLEQRIATLEARLASVETKAVRYCGVWQRALDYSRGDMTTHKGSLFACTKDAATAEPGTSDGWQLVAKSGAR